MEHRENINEKKKQILMKLYYFLHVNPEGVINSVSKLKSEIIGLLDVNNRDKVLNIIFNMKNSNKRLLMNK